MNESLNELKRKQDQLEVRQDNFGSFKETGHELPFSLLHFRQQGMLDPYMVRSHELFYLVTQTE